MIQLNSFYISDAVKFMQRMNEEIIDLTITSPPYSDMRKYNFYEFDHTTIIPELFRITKKGGVVVWVVADKTINGSESGVSFEQALFFKKSGFNLHDTMIYHKKAVGSCGSSVSYSQSFEYMFVFTKGKIKTFNPIKDLVAKKAGQLVRYAKTRSTKNGYLSVSHAKLAPLSSKRQNVWTYKIGISSGDDKTGHPAVFPEKLAKDHILSWSNENDVVFDPMCGSGTTCKMAWLNNREFIGVDCSEEYINNICIPRLEKYGWRE